MQLVVELGKVTMNNAEKLVGNYCPSVVGMDYFNEDCIGNKEITCEKCWKFAIENEVKRLFIDIQSNVSDFYSELESEE